MDNCQLLLLNSKPCLTLLKVSEIQNINKVIAIYAGVVYIPLWYREEQNPEKVWNMRQAFNRVIHIPSFSSVSAFRCLWKGQNFS